MSSARSELSLPMVPEHRHRPRGDFSAGGKNVSKSQAPLDLRPALHKEAQEREGTNIELISQRPGFIRSRGGGSTGSRFHRRCVTCEKAAGTVTNKQREDNRTRGRPRGSCTCGVAEDGRYWAGRRVSVGQFGGQPPVRRQDSALTSELAMQKGHVYHDCDINTQRIARSSNLQREPRPK